MSTYVEHNGLHIPVGALATTDQENETVTEQSIRPMRWTTDDTLETDPHGFPPITDEGAEHHQVESRLDEHQAQEQDRQDWSPRVWLKRRSENVARQLTEITSPRVIKSNQQLSDAEKLEAADADPRSEARANRRAKRWSYRALAVSIAAGLAISSSTAQTTIVDTLGWTKAADWLAFHLAYLTDPAIGVPLFVMLGITSLAVQRDVRLPAATLTAFKKCEAGLFVLVALLNGGPALAAMVRSIAVVGGAGPEMLRVMDTAGHGLMYAVIHLIGPVLVGIVIWAVPHVAGALALISTATTHRLSTPTVEANSTAGATPESGGAAGAGRPQLLQVNRSGWASTVDLNSAANLTPEETIPDPEHRSDADLDRELIEAVATGRVDPGKKDGGPVDPTSAASIRRTLRIGQKRAEAARDRYAASTN